MHVQVYMCLSYYATASTYMILISSYEICCNAHFIISDVAKQIPCKCISCGCYITALVCSRSFSGFKFVTTCDPAYKHLAKIK